MATITQESFIVLDSAKQQLDVQYIDTDKFISIYYANTYYGGSNSIKLVLNTVLTSSISQSVYYIALPTNNYMELDVKMAILNTNSFFVLVTNNYENNVNQIRTVDSYNFNITSTITLSSTLNLYTNTYSLSPSLFYKYAFPSCDILDANTISLAVNRTLIEYYYNSETDYGYQQVANTRLELAVTNNNTLTTSPFEANTNVAYYNNKSSSLSSNIKMLLFPNRLDIIKPTTTISYNIPESLYFCDFVPLESNKFIIVYAVHWGGTTSYVKTRLVQFDTSNNTFTTINEITAPNFCIEQNRATIAKFSDNLIILSYSDTNNIIKQSTINISATTLTAGVESSKSGTIPLNMKSTIVNLTKFIVVFQNSSNSSNITALVSSLPALGKKINGITMAKWNGIAITKFNGI